MGMPAMEIRYTLTLKDLIALNVHLTRKSGLGRVRYLVGWFGPQPSVR
jgi:hypothetical protein